MSSDRLDRGRQWSGTGGCATGKRCFHNRRAAKDFASLARRNGADVMRPYACPSCGTWHIGHQPRAVREGKVSAAEHYARP